MTLVYRSTVGRRLTVSEGDGNISDLSASIGGLVIGTDVQAWDADLDAIAALAKTDGNFVVGDGAAWVAESGATARTSLGATVTGDALFIAADAAAARTTLGAFTDWQATSGIVIKRKTADESVTSSTTLQDDDHLVFPIGANEEWVANFNIDVSAYAVPGGFKIAITTPGGATQDIFGSFNAASGVSVVGRTTASGTVLLTVETSGSGVIRLHVWVLNGATTGNVTLQWAQVTSSGTPSTFAKGSHLVAHRIA